jgi:hypothetical protein
MGHSSSLSLFENTLGQQQVYGKKLMDWSMIKATFLNNDQYTTTVLIQSIFEVFVLVPKRIGINYYSGWQ